MRNALKITHINGETQFFSGIEPRASRFKGGKLSRLVPSLLLGRMSFRRSLLLTYLAAVSQSSSSSCRPIAYLCVAMRILHIHKRPPSALLNTSPLSPALPSPPPSPVPPSPPRPLTLLEVGDPWVLPRKKLIFCIAAREFCAHF